MSEFAYDDQECANRGPGLKHVRKNQFDIDCQYCGESVFSAAARMWLGFMQERPEPKPDKDSCQFWTCDTKVTVRAFLTVWQTLPVVDVSLAVAQRDRPEDNSVQVKEDDPTWLCFEHNAAVKSAPKRRLKVRRSLEGWLWIDVLDHIRFAA